MKYSINISDKQLTSIENAQRSIRDNRKVPKVIVNFPANHQSTTSEMISSAELMLKCQLDGIKTHLEIDDDFIPQVRVEFGTAQIAHAFGCSLYVPDYSPVCAQNSLPGSSADIAALEIPALDAGWFQKAYEFTEYFLENKPEWVGMELLDFQSPFNNAHLVRGNHILFDFYDDPENLDILLEKMTSYQIKLVQHYRSLIGMEAGYMYDWGIIWKGNARLSNCSIHLISTAFYDSFVRKHDTRFINEVGTARIHYCGTHDDGLTDSFCGIPGMTGLDMDGQFHDLWRLSDVIPEDIPLLIYTTNEQNSRILSGDIPPKRNLIIQATASKPEEAKRLCKALKSALL